MPHYHIRIVSDFEHGTKAEDVDYDFQDQQAAIVEAQTLHARYASGVAKVVTTIVYYTDGTVKEPVWTHLTHQGRRPASAMRQFQYTRAGSEGPLRDVDRRRDLNWDLPNEAPVERRVEVKAGG